jgi:hypothetical protein
LAFGLALGGSALGSALGGVRGPPEIARPRHPE